MTTYGFGLASSILAGLLLLYSFIFLKVVLSKLFFRVRSWIKRKFYI